MERRRRKGGGHGTVLRSGKQPMSLTAAMGHGQRNHLDIGHGAKGGHVADFCSRGSPGAGGPRAVRSQGDPAGFPASARAIPRTNGPIVSIVLTPRCKEYLFRSTLDLPNNGEAGRFWT